MLSVFTEVSLWMPVHLKINFIITLGRGFSAPFMNEKIIELIIHCA